MPPFYVNEVTVDKDGLECVAPLSGPYHTEAEAEAEADRLCLAEGVDHFHTEGTD